MKALVITAARVVNGLKPGSAPCAGPMDRTPQAPRAQRWRPYLICVLATITTGSVQAGPAMPPEPLHHRLLEYSTADLGGAKASLQPGDLLWSFYASIVLSSCPALATDGIVYVGSWGGVLAVDGATGAKKRDLLAEGEYVITSPVLGSDRTVYVTAASGKVYAFNGDTGAQKWVFATGGVISASSPAVGSDNTVYLGSLDHKVYALDGGTGAQKWAFATGDCVTSSAAISADGTVYVGSCDKKIYALDGATGTQKWAFVTGDQVSSSPTIGADGTVYVGSGDGRLYALRGSAGLASSPWPKVHHDAQNTGASAKSNPFVGPPVILLAPVDTRLVENTTAT